MSGLELPDLVADASPEFIDERTCKAWLENVPLANVATAQRQLFEQLAKSLGSEVRPQERGFLDWLKEALGG